MSAGEVTPREFDAVINGVRGALEALARQVAEGAERSSKEHTEVRNDLKELQRQLDTGVPSAEEFGSFKQYTYGRFDRLERQVDAVEDEADRRRAIERWKRWAFGAFGTVLGLLIALAGVIVAAT